MITVEELDAMMIHGGALQRFEDPAVIYEIASRGKTYVEIGTRWGGSAIVAGLAGCEVYCIDKWSYPTKLLHEQTKPEHVIENWANAGLDPNKLHLYHHEHPPWPKELEGMFDIGMIDGAHSERQVREDWAAIRIRVSKYILFHDIHKKWGPLAGSNTSAGNVFVEATTDKAWKEIELSFKSQFGILEYAPSA